MERLETIVVQLEECKRFVLIGRVPHLRLALILLDNAAEILMQRRLERELVHDEFYARLHHFIDGVDAPAEEKGAQKAKLGYELLSKGRKRKLERLFPEKAQFLSRERDHIPKETADVLCYLHRYRNEAHHDDRVRPGSLRPAVLVLFDVLCDLLVLLGTPSTYVSDADYRWAQEYGINPSWPNPDACLKVATSLREGLPLDVHQIGTSLTTHIHDRLTAMVEGLDFIGPDDPHEETLKALQFWNEDRSRNPRERGQVFIDFEPEHTMESIVRWRGQVHDLGVIDEKRALFRAFAAVEQEMEPLEGLVTEVVGLVDQASQLQADLDRGK